MIPKSAEHNVLCSRFCFRESSQRTKLRSAALSLVRRSLDRAPFSLHLLDPVQNEHYNDHSQKQDYFRMHGAARFLSKLRATREYSGAVLRSPNPRPSLLCSDCEQRISKRARARVASAFRLYAHRTDPVRYHVPRLKTFRIKGR